MRKALAVIGAGYGDEGKGLMTDYLASLGADVVVRTNGGAQAGHTVTTPEGFRHVFHHFASGSLAGVESHLSKFFVSNPVLFGSEFDALQAAGADTRISADPRGLVTTPYDMMINQIIENRRAGKRHGSCGVGFGETIERNLHPDLSLTIGDLYRGKDVGDLMRAIRTAWVEDRIAALGGGALTPDERKLVLSDEVIERFVLDCIEFSSLVNPMDDAALGGDVIFEGAQGLMLDQDYGAFPHVTRSNTGLLNMTHVAAEAGIDQIDAHYMTRAYVTRHGAGPMLHEGDDMGSVEIEDETNRPNDWQGAIRAAPLDLDVLSGAISHDTSIVSADIGISPSLVVTCLDQLRGPTTVYHRGRRIAVSPDQLVCEINCLVDYEVSHGSSAPTRTGVQPMTLARSAA